MAKFTNNLIKECGSDFFAIDIGYVKDKQKWCIVEINPCFSLDDFGVDIKSYMMFTFDFYNKYIASVN